MKKYRITLTEKQMHILKSVCELRFRLDLCQGHDLAEILATMNNLDLSPNNPKHKEIFHRYLDRRDDLSAIINCLFEVACPLHLRGTDARQRDYDSLIAEDIWQSLRYCLWLNNPDRYKMGYVVDSNKPLPCSDEPIPEIEVIDE